MTRSGHAASLATAVVTFFVATPIASAHLWQIEEVYSSVDGRVQYIELYCTEPDQGSLDGETITASSDGSDITFTFIGNLGGSSDDQHLLLGTPGFANIPGAVPPDYVLPCGPFFDPASTNVTLTFVGSDTVSFSGALLPNDGSASLRDTNLGGVANLVTGPSSPTNNTGDVGAPSLSGCLQTGTCEPCDDAVACTGVESCVGSACVATGACPGVCDVAADTCVDCVSDADCDDGNPCATPHCEAGACVDALASDGTPCDDDGSFCSGVETCQLGVCTSLGNPCSIGETCDDEAGSCSETCADEPGCGSVGGGGAGGGGGAEQPRVDARGCQCTSAPHEGANTALFFWSAAVVARLARRRTVVVPPPGRR